jgi:hypothetical protein
MIKEEIKLIKETPKDLRKFGLTIGTVLFLIAAFLFFTDKSSYIYFAVPGLILIVSGILSPSILKPFNKVWMMVAIILGWFMTRFILSVLFYLILTPIGIIAKISGKDFLKLNIDKTKTTYWEKRDKKVFEPVDYERQF